MLYAGYIPVILIEILLPIALLIYFRRKFGGSWKMFGVGALTFIVWLAINLTLFESYLFPWLAGLRGSLPLGAWAVTAAVAVGLATGLIQSGLRWLGFWLTRKWARNLGSALSAGVGHGGLEIILAGASVLFNFGMFVILSNNWGTTLGMTNDFQAQMAQQLYGTMLAMPWYVELIRMVPLLFGFILQVGLSVMIWQSVMRRSWEWLLTAVLWQAFVEGITIVMSIYEFNPYLIEGVVALTAIANVAFLVWFGRQQLADEAEGYDEDEEDTDAEESEEVEPAADEPDASEPDEEKKEE